MSNDFTNLESPSVQAQVDPSTATLGDLLTLRIRVTHPPALQIDSPTFSKTIGTFEIYSSTRLPTEQAGSAPGMGGEKSVDQFEAALQNFTTGPQVLPGLDVPYRDPMGHVHSVKTPELTVSISELPPGAKDKGDIRGIKGVIGPTAWSPAWWGLLAIVLAGLGAYAWMKRKRRIAGPPSPPLVAADQTALEKLQKLAQANWLAMGKSKEYYSAISDILREYLEKGFQISALERTTNELMRDLRKKSEILTERQVELRELLETCDLVKFAKFRPEVNEGNAVHAAAVRFVEQTRALLAEEAEIQKRPLENRRGGVTTP